MLNNTTYFAKLRSSVVASHVSMCRAESFTKDVQGTSVPFGGGIAVNDPKLRVVPPREVTVLS